MKTEPCYICWSMAAKSIFLIEDDKIYGEYLSKSLGPPDEYKVHHFLTAEDALRAMATEMPDAWIVDFQLPRMSGIELFEKIKDKTSNEVKIIMLSAIDDGSMVLGFIQKGVRDYVIKDESVIESLQAILSGKDEDYFLFN